MSFDIFFFTERYTGDKVVQKNPFTGKNVKVEAKEPLTATEIKRLRAVLKKFNATGPDEDECYHLDLEGCLADVNANRLETGCMISLWGMTTEMIQFLYEFLKAGNWVMVAPMDDPVAITTSPDSVKRYPKDSLKLVTCKSAKELGLILTKGMEGWQKYRDQAVGDQ